MSIRVLIIYTALIALPGLGFAQSPNDRVVSGAGWISCGQYIEHGADTNTSVMYVHWAQGFLSGMNMANVVANMAANAANDRNVVILPDAASIKAYLDKYCRENPLDRVINGTMRLFDDLQDRKK